MRRWKKSLVGGIILTYRRSEKLINSIESVTKSTYRNAEIMMINDCPGMTYPLCSLDTN